MDRNDSQSGTRKEDDAATVPSRLEEAPDPEEDDLDDLDDMLDEFSTTKIKGPEHPLPKPSPEEDSRGSDSADGAETNFSKQLEDQMAALMGNGEESPEMRKEIEAIMQEIGAIAAGPEAPIEQNSQSKEGANEKAGSSKIEEPFQETIRKTMKRMQASEDQATTASEADESEDFLARMLKEMQNSGNDGSGSNESFDKMLMGMMEQLTNKDILYEPMKELNDKFPSWMAKNKASMKADDLARYEEQERLVGQIVKKFDEKGYSDSKASDREFIVERMQLMQAAGSPPADLVGDMNAAQEALADVDSGCAQQ